MKYKFLNHTADIKFQAFGKTTEQSFRNSFFAMKNLLIGRKKIKGKIKKEIKIFGMDLNNLLYNFLEEFLYLLEVEEILVEKVEKIKIDKETFKLTAVIVGDSAKNYKLAQHIKAITYSQMFVKKIKTNWVCQVVMDI